MNDKKNETVYLDKAGYDALLQSIEQLKEELQKNNMERKKAFGSGFGDRYSLEIEEIERTSTRISGQLKMLYEELSKVVVIEKHNDKQLIDIGDTIVVDIMFSSDDSEEVVIKIVGGNGNFDTDIQEVSINSPLGSAVYKRKVGDTCSYSVDDRNISVLIKQKLELTKEEDDPAKKLIK